MPVNRNGTRGTCKQLLQTLSTPPPSGIQQVDLSRHNVSGGGETSVCRSTLKTSTNSLSIGEQDGGDAVYACLQINFKNFYWQYIYLSKVVHRTRRKTNSKHDMEETDL